GPGTPRHQLSIGGGETGSRTLEPAQFQRHRVRSICKAHPARIWLLRNAWLAPIAYAIGENIAQTILLISSELDPLASGSQCIVGTTKIQRFELTFQNIFGYWPARNLARRLSEFNRASFRIQSDIL